MCHRHVGQIGQYHGFATFMEMRETESKHNSSKGKSVRNGRETVVHCVQSLHLRKVAVVTEIGYQNYSNNINAPFEMFTSIAVVNRQQANNGIRLTKLLKQHRRAFGNVHLNCSCGHVNKERKFLNCRAQNFSCQKISHTPEETVQNALSSHQSW